MSKQEASNNKDLQSLHDFADLMDSRFVIPGTTIRFGLDSIIGLVPGVGDTVTLASTFYLIGKAQAHDVPKHVPFVMLWNAFIDWLIGLVPLVGDIFDIGWKANKKNVALIHKYAERQPPSQTDIS